MWVCTAARIYEGMTREISRKSTRPSSHPTASNGQVGLSAKWEGVTSGGNQKRGLLSGDKGIRP